VTTSIAIIIPVFNEAENLPKLLRMLSSLDADEIVLVDGGSQDDSQILLGRSPFRWLQSDKGRAAQMNAGADVCESNTILFLHADTVVDNSAIVSIRDAMTDHKVVGGRFDLKLSGAHFALRLIEWMINLRSRLTKISTGDQAMFVRQSVFEELGGFSNQPLMEDIELSRRLKQKGKVACLREKITTSSRRWEQFGLIKTTILMWKLRFLYWIGISPNYLAQIYLDAR